jgi:hypothetical protein
VLYKYVFQIFHFLQNVQGDFESCADILTSGRTPQYVTIEPRMPYKNVDIFREKRAKMFSKKVWGSFNFMKKMGIKNHSRLFCCHLIQN